MGVIYGYGQLGGWHQLGYGWVGLSIAMCVSAHLPHVFDSVDHIQLSHLSAIHCRTVIIYMLILIGYILFIMYMLTLIGYISYNYIP
jgi:hypothetical protein